MGFISTTNNRKDEHVGHANQQYRATSAPGNSWNARFVHHPFTTKLMADVSLQTKLAFGLTFDVPFFINAITGGSPSHDCVKPALSHLGSSGHGNGFTGLMSIAMKFPESAESLRGDSPETKRHPSREPWCA